MKKTNVSPLASMVPSRTPKAILKCLLRRNGALHATDCDSFAARHSLAGNEYPPDALLETAPYKKGFEQSPAGADPAEYPAVLFSDSKPRDFQAFVSASALAKAIQATVVACDPDASRYVLSCMQLCSWDGNDYLVATDGNRLHAVKLDVATFSGVSEWRLTCKHAKVLATALSKSKTDCLLSSSEHYHVVSANLADGSTLEYETNIEGRFPRVEQVVEPIKAKLGDAYCMNKVDVDAFLELLAEIKARTTKADLSENSVFFADTSASILNVKVSGFVPTPLKGLRFDLEFLVDAITSARSFAGPYDAIAIAAAIEPKAKSANAIVVSCGPFQAVLMSCFVPKPHP